LFLKTAKELTIPIPGGGQIVFDKRGIQQLARDAEGDGKAGG
jgi:hypothetical protein